MNIGIIRKLHSLSNQQFFRTSANDQSVIEPFNRIPSYDVTAGYDAGESNTYDHKMGRVPFIPFPKNKYQQPDLFKYKGLIDAYDHIYSGFLNDVSASNLSSNQLWWY